MKWIWYLFSSIWRLWFLLMFFSVFLIFIPALFFFTSICQNNKTVCHLTRYWSKLTLYLSFIFPKVEWEEKLTKNEHYIFCPNHVSTLDIPLILAILPIPLQFMGKAEIASIPIFGWLYKNNSVIVDRSKIKDSYYAFKKAEEKLEQGLSMCIFPEGGIPSEKIFLKKFKNGPFRLAIEQNIKIVPITLADNKTYFPQEYFKGRPGIVRVKIHKAINPATFEEKTIENLNTTVYNTIFEQLKRYENNG
ncbi:MAG: 1-acyl-sn-glycerol-3-phosphate acyltransferase [Flavobacteriales bacterium]|nr:1-acyl-sn-glycerol-3-phosphate acyltransferase [Flavobacteriales bacterium]